MYNCMSNIRILGLKIALSRNGCVGVRRMLHSCCAYPLPWEIRMHLAHSHKHATSIDVNLLLFRIHGSWHPQVDSHRYYEPEIQSEKSPKISRTKHARLTLTRNYVEGKLPCIEVRLTALAWPMTLTFNQSSASHGHDVLTHKIRFKGYYLGQSIRKIYAHVSG